jgi:hypothetical protein
LLVLFVAGVASLRFLWCLFVEFLSLIHVPLGCGQLMCVLLSSYLCTRGCAGEMALKMCCGSMFLTSDWCGVFSKGGWMLP